MMIFVHFHRKYKNLNKKVQLMKDETTYQKTLGPFCSAKCSLQEGITLKILRQVVSDLKGFEVTNFHQI